MSKQANKTFIGAFVVGAIVLAIIGVLVLGSGKFLSERIKGVLYFEGSVKGLNVGAPVMFRGVKIGTVTDIQLHFDSKDLSVRIPVVVEIEPEKFKTITGETLGEYRYLEQLIERGLKAQLISQSMVTGQLIVNFDFFPEKPAKLTGIESKYPEVPTIPSAFEELTKTIENLPLDVLFNKLLKAVEGIEKVVNSPELMESVSSLNNALKDVQHLVRNIDSRIEPIASSIEDAADAARGTFVQTEKALTMKEGLLEETLEAGRDALKQTEKTLLTVQEITSKDSKTVYELNNTLEELSTAARSIRFLTDYLEQHPEALLKGKGESKGE
jgi:paraquat-inducible protein B